MRPSSFVLLAGAVTMVNAHFELAFPPPRGPFDDANEVNFCDNYVQAVSNRSEFPLSGGFVTLTSEHTSWTLGIIISTVQDPTSFNDFNNSSGQQQFARDYASATGAGDFCIPLDLSNTGISGVSDGANVTIQFVYDGGDSNLYQCADLTLSQNFTIPSNVTCSNSSTTATSATGTATSTATATSTSDSNSTTTNGAKEISASGFVGALGFLIALITA